MVKNHSNKVSLVILFLSFLLIQSCSSKSNETNITYPDCKPIASSESSRLNIHLTALDFGMFPPCSGTFQLYVNSNSQIRSLVFDIEYRNLDDEVFHEEQLRAVLKESSTGMFKTEIAINPVEGKSCISLEVFIPFIKCYSAGDHKINCPDIRIISGSAFKNIYIEEKTLRVCAETI